MSYNTCKPYYRFVTSFIGTMHHEVTIVKFVNKYCMKLVMKLGIIVVIVMFCNNSSFTEKQGYNSSVPCIQFPNKQIARRTMKKTTASCPSSMIFTSPGYIVAQSPADLGSSIIEEG